MGGDGVGFVPFPRAGGICGDKVRSTDGTGLGVDPVILKNRIWIRDTMVIPNALKLH